jgi:5-carboxymethyl-2-hydroxymuconate isomerase
MRLGTAIAGGSATPVVERDGALHPLDVPAGTTLLDLVRAGGDAVATAVAGAGDALAGARPAAPLRPGKIVAIGLNYLDHVRETGMEAPARPLIFAKWPTSVVGPDEAIIIDSELTERVDWEVELAAVIGATARDVPVERALEHVLGYTVGNDVSGRDVQFADGQWVRGKSFDTFCPLGPAIVTADELPDPQALRLGTRVNGEVVQDSSTSEMVFGVAELIAFCSRSFTLEPGDLLMTGTPWGCGEFMDPKRSLAPGDVVECEVEGIGVLRNPVRGPGG